MGFATLTRGGHMREFWLPVALLIFAGTGFFLLTRSSDHRPRLVWQVDIPLLLLLGWASLTYITSINREQTLYEAMRLTALVSVYFLAAYGLQGESMKKALLIGVLAIGLLQAFYGLLSFVQGEHLLKLPWFEEIEVGTRVRGTFVNSNHFADYLSMATLVGFGLMAGVSFGEAGERLAKRIILIVACSFTFLGLVLSLSRGTWFSFSAGCILLVVFFWWIKRPRFARLGLLALVLFVIGGAFLAGSELKPLSGRIESLGRYYQSPEQISANGRFSIWESTLEMIKDDPVMGKGWGTFKRAFPAYRNSEWLRGAHFAHNDYLQICAEAGIPALVFFLVFVFMVFKKGIDSLRMRQEGPMDKVLPGVLAALAALLLHAFMDFNLMIPSSSLGFFALAGVVTGSYAETGEDENTRYTSKSRWEKILVGVLLAAFAIRALQSWSAALYHNEGEHFEKQEQTADAIKMYESSVSLQPLHAGYHHSVGGALFKRYREGRASTDYLRRSFQHYKRATELEPFYPYHWFEAAMVLQVLEQQGVTGFPPSKEYLDKSLQIDSHHPRFLSGLVHWELQKNSRARAQEAFYKLYLIYPQALDAFASALFNNRADMETFGEKLNGHPQAALEFAGFMYDKGYQDLAAGQINKIPKSKLIETDPVLAARIAIAAGEREEALEILARAWQEREKYRDTKLGRLLASLYERDGQFTKAMKVWQELLKKHPGRVVWNYRMGRLADKMDKPNLALKYFQKVALEENVRKKFRKKAYLAIGKIMQDKNRTAEALQAYEFALELTPDDGSLEHRVRRLKIELEHKH